MNCDESLILISGHLDGTNTEAEEKKLREHLKTCEDCRRLLSQMEENDRLLRENKTEVPADLKDRIMKEVRKEKKNKKPFYFSVAASGLAVAAMLTLVFVGRGAAKPQNLPVMADDASESISACTEAVPADYQLDGEAQKPRECRGLPEATEQPVLVICGAEAGDLEELDRAEPLTKEELQPFTEFAEGVETGYELPRAQLMDIMKECEGHYAMTKNFSPEDYFRSAVLLLTK